MKKSLRTLLMASLAVLCLSGCQTTQTTTTASTAATEATTVAETEVPSESSSESTANETTQNAADTETTATETSETQEPSNTDTPSVRVGALKGPTSMGLVGMMEEPNYSFTMVTAADELLAKIASKDIDIALVPANVASVLYNKTSGVSVIDINTLGVLYIVAADESLQTITDLKGKTIYLTGKGTTPDYSLQYLLSANGLSASDVTLEYKSEATEVAAILKEQSDAIGLLPQPFATVACIQNEALKPVMNLTEQWDMVQGENGSRLVTGVTIVRNEFLEENPDAVKEFMALHKESSAYVNENPEKAAEKIAELGIVEKAPIALKALPYCNITYIDGQEMKDALSGYLSVLHDQEPASIGGKLPEDAFYFFLQ